MSMLLPCPFCGASPEPEVNGVEKWGLGNQKDYANTIIRCRCPLKPMAHGTSYWRGWTLDGNEFIVWRTHEEASDLATEDAIRKWNTRTQAAASQAPGAGGEGA